MTTQEVLLDQYPSFSNVGPLTHSQNPEVSLGLDADFEDVVPASNFDLMDFFNVENEASSDLVQNPPVSILKLHKHQIQLNPSLRQIQIATLLT